MAQVEPALIPQQVLVPALLDFERAPGRYPLVLREPRLLFDHARTVLLLAVGRAVEGLPELDGAQESEARRAARFFVRTALLRAGVDHYTLLGLTPGAEPEQVRDHYRLMIRLTHPDFQAGGEAWPADAASRINIANDVLSSPERRAEYHAALEAPSPAPVAPSAAPGQRTQLHPQAVPHRSSFRKAAVREQLDTWWTARTKFILVALGALLSGGALVLLSPTGSGSLTVRQRTVGEETSAWLEPSRSLSALTTPIAPVVETALTASPPAAPKLAREPAPIKPAQKPLVASDAPVRSAGGDLSLSLDTRMTTLPVAEPVSAETVAVVPTAALAQAQTPPSQPAPATTRLTMAQVHPVLANLLGSLENGHGEDLARWVDPEWRQRPANRAFVTQFNQWLGAQRVAQVGKAAFSSQTQGEYLVVEGTVQLHLEEPRSAQQVRDLRLRAYFLPGEGRPALTQLVASEAR